MAGRCWLLDQLRELLAAVEAGAAGVALALGELVA
jgi:hypothetical protein